jgi:phospholipid N-methyltransferase
MLRAFKRDNTDENKIYGIQWGDPNQQPFLRFCREQYIQPYVNLGHTALEIGPGGGRWTRYLLSFQRLFVIDPHKELLVELTRKFQVPHLVAVQNSGTDLPGIPANSIDFIFSFGVFVHLDVPIIAEYLRSLLTVVKESANIVIQYSDKTKPRARRNLTFSENSPDIMRKMVTKAGYLILEENLTMLPHSSIMRFRKRRPGEISF